MALVGDAPKQAYWTIFDPTGQTILGTWNDVPTPTFRISIDGVDNFKFNLPRAFGQLDEPGELGGTNTLQEGNKVECWISDKDTQSALTTFSLVGSGLVGSSTVGQSSAGSSLIWSGYIDLHEPTPPAGVSVSLTSITQILEGSLIEGTYTFSGDPCACAYQLVQLYCPGLAWDIRNPLTSGEYVTAITFTNTTVADALKALRDACGPNWIVHVTPRGTIRFFQPDLTVAATHVFTRPSDVKLTKDATTRAKRVVVVYGSGGASRSSAQADDYITSNPRALFYRMTSISNAGDAQRIAVLKLNELNRVVLRGQCMIHTRDYNIESIEVGDTVQLNLDNPYAVQVGLSTVGNAIVGSAYIVTTTFLGYDQPLIVVGIQYAFDHVVLELSKTQPNSARILARIMRDVQNHINVG